MEKFSYHNSRFQNNENDNVKVFKFILKHSVFDHRCVDESCCKKWLGESWLVGGTIPGIARKCYDGRPAVVDRRPGSFSYPLSRGSAYFIVITWFFFFLSVCVLWQNINFIFFRFLRAPRQCRGHFVYVAADIIVFWYRLIIPAYSLWCRCYIRWPPYPWYTLIN